jgi:ArsR family transcriptional regulator
MPGSSALLNDRPPSAQPAGFDAEEIATIARALAHPARVRILVLLLEKQSCIGGDIVEEVGLAQSTVSEHLRILKAAGVISAEVEHPRVCYALAPDRLVPLAGLLDTLFEQDRRGELQGSICCPPSALSPAE